MTRHTSSWLFSFFCLAQISQVFNIRTAYDTAHVKLVVQLLLPCTDITSFQDTHCLWHDTRQVGCSASFALHRYHKFLIFALPMTRHTSSWLFSFFCLAQISQVFKIRTAYDTTHVKLMVQLLLPCTDILSIFYFLCHIQIFFAVSAFFANSLSNSRCTAFCNCCSNS